MAARGARAATDDAGDRLSRFRVAWGLSGPSGRVPPGTEGSRVRRRRERRDRLSLGNGRYDQLPALADELVRRQAAVIFAATVQSALSASTATSTIPIVFAIGSDPVKYGLAASLNRPGGNATGTSWLGGSILTGKRLELLHEAAPMARVIGALVNATNPSADDETREIKEAARALGLEIHFANASAAREIDAAFATLIQQRVGAVLIGADNFFFARRDQLIVLAARHALPAIAQWREFAALGGLMSYGTKL